MAVGQNLLFGRMKQKIGGIVTSTWKGINVIKSKPLTVANPRTDLQTMRRSALIQAVAIARTWSSVIQLGFKEQAVYKSAFNAFVGYTLRNGFNYDTPPTCSANPSDFLIAQGTISPTPIDGMSASAAGNTVNIEWINDNLLPGQSNSDLAKVALYNATSNQYIVPITADTLRTTESAEVEVPSAWITAGNTIRAYLFFYNTTSRKSSDSTTNAAIAGA